MKKLLLCLLALTQCWSSANAQTNYLDNYISNPLTLTTNPVTDVLNININNASNESCITRIVDVTGKEIYSNKFKMNRGENNFTIPVKSMKVERGIYFLSFNRNNFIATKKIAIQ